MPRPPVLLLLALAPLPIAVAAALSSKPVLLINTSASEPTGVYLATGAPPRTGARIAFRIPQPGRAYAARAMPERLRSSVLKTIVAGQGDTVCTTSGRLIINGQDWAPIAEHDRHGGSLPRWRACRLLRSGEYFVFSNRISNSFDSRYYGPVPADAVIGVYRPLRASEDALGGEGAG